MNFAQEVAQVNSQKGEPQAVISGTETLNTTSPKPEAATPAKEASPVVGHGEIHPEMAAQQAKIEPEKKASGKIRIGSEVFDTPEEAIRYAEEMQVTLLQKDAYDQGKKDAAPKAELPPEPDFFEGLENELFENPKEALKKVHAKALADAEKKSEEREKLKEQARVNAIAVDKMWEGFYSDNQDLVASKDIVKYVLDKNWDEVGHLTANKALPIIAEKARALLGSRKETILPSKELPSNQVVTTSATSGATATGPKKEGAPLDFISQLNKHRKRTA